MTLIVCLTNFLERFSFYRCSTCTLFRKAYLIYLCVGSYQNYFPLIKVDMRCFRCAGSSVTRASYVCCPQLLSFFFKFLRRVTVLWSNLNLNSCTWNVQSWSKWHQTVWGPTPFSIFLTKPRMQNVLLYTHWRGNCFYWNSRLLIFVFKCRDW